MNVVWHDHEGMQDVVPEDMGVVVVCFHDHARDGWLPEVNGSIAGIQQPVHGGKCLPRVWLVRRESPVGWQAVVETPGEEDRPANLVEVRKSSPVERHTLGSCKSLRNSQTATSRPGGRPRTKGPPHRLEPVSSAGPRGAL